MCVSRPRRRRPPVRSWAGTNERRPAVRASASAAAAAASDANPPESLEMAQPEAIWSTRLNWCVAALRAEPACRRWPAPWSTICSRCAGTRRAANGPAAADPDCGFVVVVVAVFVDGGGDYHTANDSPMELGQRQPRRWPARPTVGANRLPGNARDGIGSSRTSADTDNGRRSPDCHDDCDDDDDGKNADGDAGGDAVAETSAPAAAAGVGRPKPNGSNCARLLRSVRAPAMRSWCG